MASRIDPDYERAIRAELEQWPGVGIEFGRRAKHRQVTFRYGDASRFVVLPDSPSDWRGSKNTIRDVRKELAALGATRMERTTKPRRVRQRIEVQREALAHIERAPVKPNPFDALAGFVPTPPAPPRLSLWQRIKQWLRI